MLFEWLEWIYLVVVRSTVTCHGRRGMNLKVVARRSVNSHRNGVSDGEEERKVGIPTYIILRR